MLSTWSVTGMAKNHHCISVVYRDTTQADYDASGEAVNRSSSRHASSSSNHLDTDLNSPTRMYNGLAQDKVLTSLDKPATETALPGQAFSPATMDMWEQNETFQDLEKLIQEGKGPTVLPPVSSQSCYILPSSLPSHQISSTSSGTTVLASPSRSCSSSPSTTSQTTWQPQSPPSSSATTTTPVSVKRPLSPVCEPGPSHAGGRCSPKLQKVEEPPRYSDMRVKNNMASRRSRMTRKEKELEMEKRASELEQENELLRIKVKNLEELTDRLKKHLISSIVKK
ncbi:uncharacterized protein LOC119172398 isoform X2 [Rhipicephalus microplus]|uniref:uncharacterized protein LOC119172398 isoform X2 n=1 Tax=Rhipicephalus microplus TaxID=6941 RepID=UPI003F6D3226